MLRDDLDAQNRDELAGLTLEERIALAGRAGMLQLELYAQQHGLDLDTARQNLERNKQRGRRPCSFLDTP